MYSDGTFLHYRWFLVLDFSARSSTEVDFNQCSRYTYQLLHVDPIDKGIHVSYYEKTSLCTTSIIFISTGKKYNSSSDTQTD